MSIKRVQPAKATKKKPTSTLTESMPAWLELLLAKYGQAPGPLAGLAIQRGPQTTSTGPSASVPNGDDDADNDHDDDESEATDEVVEEKPIFHEDVPDWLDSALKQPMPDLTSTQSTSTTEPSRNVDAPDWLNEALEDIHSTAQASQTVAESGIAAETATVVQAESSRNGAEIETDSAHQPEGRKVIKLSELPRQPDPSTQGFGDWLSTLSKAKQDKAAAESDQDLAQDHDNEPPSEVESRGEVPDWLADMSPLTADTSLPNTPEETKPPADKSPKKKPVKKKSPPKSLKDRLAKGSN